MLALFVNDLYNAASMEDKEKTEHTKESEKERIKRIKKHTYKIFFRVLLIITIPAIVGAVLGLGIDSALNIRPYGTLATLAIFYGLTWSLVIWYIKKIDFKAEEDE